MTWAHHSLIHGDREGLKTGLWCTILLGLLFSAIQAYEYWHAPFGFGGNTYSSAFYMATGFHGFHVIVGTIFLIICLRRHLPRPLHPAPALRLRSRPRGTGTSSTWCGCSCSSRSTSGAAGAPNTTGHGRRAPRAGQHRAAGRSRGRPARGAWSSRRSIGSTRSPRRSPGFVWRLTGEGNNATDLQPTPDPLLIQPTCRSGPMPSALFDFVYRSAHPVMARRREFFDRYDGAVSRPCGGSRPGTGRGTRRSLRPAVDAGALRSDAARLHLQAALCLRRELGALRRSTMSPIPGVSENASARRERSATCAGLSPALRRAHAVVGWVSFAPR